MTSWVVVPGVVVVSFVTSQVLGLDPVISVAPLISTRFDCAESRKRNVVVSAASPPSSETRPSMFTMNGPGCRMVISKAFAVGAVVLSPIMSVTVPEFMLVAASACSGLVTS